MKRREERRRMWGEGWLMAVALAALLAFCLAMGLSRQPQTVSVLPVHAVSEEALARVEMVNINTADAEELAKLPGIGSVLAERIVDYRAENGNFASIEQIMDVPGVGEGKFAVLREWIYVE